MYAKTVPRFNLAESGQHAEMLKYLEEYGYAVVASVASENEIQNGKDLFWKHINSISSIVKRDNPSTWDTETWIASPTDGICSCKGFNHSEFAWNTRLLSKVKQAFECIWNTNNLIVSFDAGNVFRPWKYNNAWITEGGWWHVDQNAMKGESRQGKVCIQGLVTYYDVNEDTGGLCVIPKSHLIHNSICELYHNGNKSIDYISIPSTDQFMMEHSGILICAKAGDLLLWDSRTIHCNTPALTSKAK